MRGAVGTPESDPNSATMPESFFFFTNLLNFVIIKVGGELAYPDSVVEAQNAAFFRSLCGTGVWVRRASASSAGHPIC